MDGSYGEGVEAKGALPSHGDVRECGELGCQVGFVDRDNITAEACQDPAPSSGAGSQVKASLG